MTDSDPKNRFSDRVGNYVRYRPGYPSDVLKFLVDTLQLRATSVVVDVGSGTGIFSKLLLQSGAQVYAVEPNEPMRTAAEQELGSYDTFHSISGSAEQTGLPAHSVDFVTAATAFHWFDQEKARIEFRRMLRPGGYVVLIWNVRKDRDEGFSRDYEELLKLYGTDYSKLDSKKVAHNEIMTRFFAPNHFSEVKFANFQEFDFAGLKGRLMSSSYIPNESHPRHQSMLEDLKAIFNRYQVNGAVRMSYDTKLYWGQLS